jgi:hypothetical protein
MKLSAKAIEDFKKAHLKESKINLTDDSEANRLGIELLNFVKLTCRLNLEKTRYENH